MRAKRYRSVTVEIRAKRHRSDNAPNVYACACSNVPERCCCFFLDEAGARGAARGGGRELRLSSGGRALLEVRATGRNGIDRLR
eukprot:4700956-Prymnesium_polylepis.1